MRCTLLTISVILFSSTLFAQSPEVLDAFEQRQFRTAEGDSLLYRWLSPEKVEEGETYPLILFLHGAGERGNDNTAQLTHVLPRFVEPQRRSRYPAFIFAPQCPSDDYWTHGDFTDNREGFILNDTMGKALSLTVEALALMVNRYPIDPDRVYIVGLSMGGGGTWELIMRFPDFFAAAVPICGFSDPRYAGGLAGLPIWAFHGLEDNVVPPALSQQMVNAVNEAGGHALLTEFPGVGHGSWEPAFPEEPFIYDWLFGQRRSN